MRATKIKIVIQSTTKTVFLAKNIVGMEVMTFTRIGIVQHQLFGGFYSHKNLKDYPFSMQ